MGRYFKYEQAKPKKYNIVQTDGNVGNMKKEVTTPAPAPTKSYSKTRGEHFKDLVICALVIGIVAFVGGTVYADKQNDEVRNAVSAAQVVPAPASK